MHESNLCETCLAQGRYQCPAPEACEVPDDDELAAARGTFFAAIVSAIIGTLAAMAWGAFQ